MASVDFTTLSGENIYLTSLRSRTSNACRMFTGPEFKAPLGPPPPVPTAPKPRKPITRKRFGDMAAAHNRNMDNSQKKLRSMSFKIQELECRFHRLQPRTESMKIRDQQIKRCFEEIREKRSNIAASTIDNFYVDHVSGEDQCSIKRKRFESNDSTISQSESDIGVFRRESCTRKAVWKKRKEVISMFVSPADEFCPLSPKTKTQPTVDKMEETSKPVKITNKTRKKVRRPPSFRLKTFIQKRFNVFA